jgi:hypothetical protein
MVDLDLAVTTRHLNRGRKFHRAMTKFIPPQFNSSRYNFEALRELAPALAIYIDWLYGEAVSLATASSAVPNGSGSNVL